MYSKSGFYQYIDLLQMSIASGSARSDDISSLKYFSLVYTGKFEAGEKLTRTSILVIPRRVLVDLITPNLLVFSVQWR
jgi:hypothetical protein